MHDSFILRPIGTVHSSFKTRKEVSLKGGLATLEIHPEYVDGLTGLESSSHLVVMGYLHLADRSVLETRALKLDPNAPFRGVFATRSPARPNPVSMTVVPLLSRDGRFLEVDHLDLVDGTPLLDIKSYSPGWDGIFSARHEHRAATAAIDDRRLSTCLERDLENFMGESARKKEARWGLAAAFVGARSLDIDPREPSMTVSVNRRDATTEALMAVTGAAFFNGRLEVVPSETALRVAFRHGAHRAELEAILEELPTSYSDWRRAFSTTVSNG